MYDIEYSMVIGRFQCLPPHDGHLGIIKALLAENKNVFIALRDTPICDTDPYSVEERVNAFGKIFADEIKSGRIVVGSIPNVLEVVYGRTPRWKIREVKLDEKTESISATAIRKSQGAQE